MSHIKLNVRQILIPLLVVIAFGAMGSGQSAALAQGTGTTYTLDAAALAAKGLVAGDSIVGQDKVLPDLNIHQSGDNDVRVLLEGSLPAAYGAPNNSSSITNGCMFNAGVGLADLGDTSLTGIANRDSRAHDYVFTFTDGVSLSEFSIAVVDWGDYLPFGKNDDGIYALSLYGYDSDGNLVDQDTLSFTSDGGSSRRTSDEFGDLWFSGDACDAEPGQPGNHNFQIAGQSITRVELRFKDRPSVDPNVAFYLLSYTVEGPVAVDDYAITELNTPVVLPSLSNDSDPNNNPINITSYDMSSTNGGTVTCDDTICTYTPPLLFTGEDSFTYTICNTFDLCSTATAFITVNEPTSVGCTATQGYWKNHSAYSNHDDATWDLVGEDSPFFLSGQSYYEVLETPTKGKSYYILAHQYIAFELNVLSGATVPDDVLDVAQEAKSLLETTTPEEAAKDNHWKDLASVLDDYNNGRLGPGHCD